MAYVIEKGLPIPPKGCKDPEGLLAVLLAMEVGDSVLVTDKPQTKCSPYMTKAARGNDRHYTSRTVEGGVRIWRDE